MSHGYWHIDSFSRFIWHPPVPAGRRVMVRKSPRWWTVLCPCCGLMRPYHDHARAIRAAHNHANTHTDQEAIS